MNTSVYISIDDKSKNIIDNIVTAYNSSEIRPDEIIINAFGVNNSLFLENLTKIKKKEYNNVIIYVRKLNDSVSNSLNYAKSLTKNEIILFHNNNSIPNTKRVEIVKKYFENLGIYVLHHTFSYKDIIIDDKTILNFENIIKSDELYKRYYPFVEKYNPWQYTRTYGQEFGISCVDMYSVCVHRCVLNDIRWKNDYEYELYRGKNDGYGYEFALETLYKYKKSDILNIPLTIIK